MLATFVGVYEFGQPSAHRCDVISLQMRPQDNEAHEFGLNL